MIRSSKTASGLILAYMLLFFLLTPGAAAAGQKLGLMVGINTYSHFEENTLQFAESDALAINSAFSNFIETKTILGEQANANTIRREFEKFVSLSQKQPLDMFVFYFSGHGSYVLDRSGDEADGFDEVIVPHDGNLENEYSLLTDDEINGFLKKIVARQILVILDSCYSGFSEGTFSKTKQNLAPPAPDGTSLDRRAKSVNNRYEKTHKSIGVFNEFARDLASDSIKRNVIVISASTSSSLAYEEKELGHGVLTYFLLQELKQNHAAASIGTVFSRVRQSIIGHFSDKGLDDAQAPQIMGYSKWFSWNGSVHAPLGWNAGGYSTANTNVCDIPSLKQVSPRQFHFAGERKIPGIKNYSPGNTADLDQVGGLEMIFTENNRLLVTDMLGKEKWKKTFGFPISLNLVDDFDSDLLPEIALTARSNGQARALILDGNGTTKYEFSIDAATFNGRTDSGIRIWQYLDFDGDGIKEILYSVTTGYAHKPRGIRIHNPRLKRDTMRFDTGPTVISVNVKDFDKDGRYEIAVGTYAPGNGNQESHGKHGKSSDQNSHLFVVRDTGEVVFQHPIAGYFTGVHTAIDDLNLDGAYEILGFSYAAANHRRDLGAISIYDHVGALIHQKKFSNSVTSYAVANFFGSKKKEIAVTTGDGQLLIFDSALNIVAKSDLTSIGEDRYLVRDDFKEFYRNQDHSVKKFTFSRLFRPSYESVKRDALNLGGTKFKIEVANDLDGDGNYELVIYKWFEDPISLNPRNDMGIKTEIHYYDMRLIVLKISKLGIDVWRSFTLGESNKKPIPHRVVLSDINHDDLVDILVYSDSVKYYSASDFQ